MSNNQTTTSSGESRKTQPTSCCGGPAPAGVSACCAQDAAVKSRGGHRVRMLVTNVVGAGSYYDELLHIAETLADRAR